MPSCEGVGEAATGSGRAIYSGHDAARGGEAEGAAAVIVSWAAVAPKKGGPRVSAWFRECGAIVGPAAQAARAESATLGLRPTLSETCRWATGAVRPPT